MISECLILYIYVVHLVALVMNILRSNTIQPLCILVFDIVGKLSKILFLIAELLSRVQLNPTKDFLWEQ